MSKLDDVFLKGIRESIKSFLKDVISRKLSDESVAVHSDVINLIADKVLNAKNESFDIDCGLDDVELRFGNEDLEEIEGRINDLQMSMPDILNEFLSSSTASMVSSIRQQWDTYRPEDVERHECFQGHLEDVWGGLFRSVRILHDVCKDVGQEYNERFRRSRAKKDRHLRSALSRLHIRACQVAGEIIVLMENGYADGAMARWRTLHEISAVASVIAEGGDCLAQRYLDHEAVEVKKGMDQYERCRAGLGYEAIPESDLQQARETYDSILMKYGKGFKESFGWAAGYIGAANSNPRFSDIEEAAGRALMRSHYKLASYSIHASPRALSNRLGCLGRPGDVVSGPTDAGFEEPAQNTAISLMQITSLLVGEPSNVDYIVKIKILLMLSAEVSDEVLRSVGKRGLE